MGQRMIFLDEIVESVIRLRVKSICEIIVSEFCRRVKPMYEIVAKKISLCAKCVDEINQRVKSIGEIVAREID